MEKHDGTISVESNITEGKTRRPLPDAEREGIAETTSVEYSYFVNLVEGDHWSSGREKGRTSGGAGRVIAFEADISSAMATQGTEVAKERPVVITFEEADISSAMATQGTEVAKERPVVVTFEELPKTPDLTVMKFLRSTHKSMRKIPLQYLGLLLLLFSGMMRYQAKSLTALQFGPQSLLSFKAAFGTFFPEMTHIAMFITCYSLTWILLVFRLSLAVKIFSAALLIPAAFYYFTEMVPMAPGVDVDCGSFRLPVIWFATFGALSLFLIFGLLVFLIVYLIWRFIDEGESRDTDNSEPDYLREAVTELIPTSA